MNLRSLLTKNMGGLPAWAWALLVGGGGLALFLFIRRQRGGGGGGQSGALGANAAGQQQPIDTSQLDPYTGVPYSIEGATNPATGLPAYYGGPGVDQTTPPTSPPTPPTQPPTQQPSPTPTPAPAPAPTPTPPPIVSRTYTVVRGDTLSRIAPRYGLSTVQLGTANNAALVAAAQAHGVSGTSRYGDYPRAWDYLYPGEQLVIPRSGSMPAGTGGNPSTVFQATPYWPIMADLETR